MNMYIFSGYLKKKTVLLITHQLQYLEQVDQLVLIENVSKNFSLVYYILCPISLNERTFSHESIKSVY